MVETGIMLTGKLEQTMRITNGIRHFNTRAYCIQPNVLLDQLMACLFNIFSSIH